jgi:hypothetical protein
MRNNHINFFKEAFHTFWNYGVLGTLCLLGLPVRFHPYFLLFALAIELGTVFTISQNQRFRRAIRSKRMAGSPLPDPSDAARIQKMLNEEHQHKWGKFKEISDQIKQNAQMVDSPRSALLGVSLGKLDSLETTYLQMLMAHQNYMKYLSQVDRDRIVRNINSIEREIKDRNDKVSGLKSKNRDILLQRLDRIDKARQNVEIVEAELDVMLNTVQLLRDQTISITDPQGISQQIDTVLANMKDTEDLVREIDMFIHEDSGSSGQNDVSIPIEENPDQTAPENDQRQDLIG